MSAHLGDVGTLELGGVLATGLRHPPSTTVKLFTTSAPSFLSEPDGVCPTRAGKDVPDALLHTNTELFPRFL